MAAQNLEEIQRWTTTRKAALVLSILKRKTSMQEDARQHDSIVAAAEDCKEHFLLVVENALRAHHRDERAVREEQTKKL